MRTVVERLERTLLVFLLLSTCAGTALADSSVAQALFDEGRRLMKAGKYSAACAKFAESQRVEPAGGTLMNLAACHAKEGKTATAWSEFNDALTQATRDGDQDRIKEAKRQVDELEPRLSRLRIITSRAAPGLEIRLDDTLLGSAALGVAIPVDPGEHELSARAPGHASFTARVRVAPGARRETVVPELKRLTAPAEKTTAPPIVARTDRPSRDQASSPPVAAYLIGGVGIVGLGVGTYFGLVARGKKRESDDECSAGQCTTRGADLLDDANSAAWASNAGFGVGVAGLAIATYLFVSTPSRDTQRSSVRIKPVLGAQAWGLDASAKW